MFATTYLEARNRFLAAAARANAQLHADIHPLKGCEGETLALDIAVLGNPQGSKRLLLTSAVHGVEGYCGSGIQTALLSDEAFLSQAAQAGVTLVFGHGINPHGFSFRRRATHENVDLNRNFQDFSKALPVNADYDVAAPLLFPSEWPPSAQNQAALGALIAQHGMVWLQQAISGGQYHDPKGIFYGGVQPTWSNGALRRLMQNHCASAAHLAWIDLHTGLGPSGHGERMSAVAAGAGADDARQTSSYERASRWWSNGGQTPLTSVAHGNSASAALLGTISDVPQQECPLAQITKMTIEYGTVPPLAVLQAMRGDQWNELNPQAAAALREANSQQMMAAFFTHTPEWQHQVLAQALQAMQQAVLGLSESL